MQASLEAFQASSGVPWLAVTILTPWAMKAVVQLPIQVKAQKEMEKMQPIMEETRAKIMQIQMKFCMDPDRMEREAAAVMKESNLNSMMWKPYKPFLLMMPLQMTLFFTFRNMADRIASWPTEGVLWFSDFASPDPTFVLPVMVGGCTYFSMMRASKSMQDANMKRIFEMMACFFGGLSVPIMHMFDAGMNVFCLSNVISGMAMGALMRTPTVREKLGLKAILPGASVDQDGNMQMDMSNPLGDQNPYTSKPAEEKPISKEEQFRMDVIKYGIFVQVVACGMFIYGLQELSKKDEEEEKKEREEAARKAVADAIAQAKKDGRLPVDE